MSRRPLAWQAKRLWEWSKGVLIETFVKENDVVCDLWCGPGTNTNKFIRAKAQFYLGLDPFVECLELANKKWEQERKGDMEAEFRNLDPLNGDYANIFDGVGLQLGEFDVVTCFGKLQLCWGSQEQAKKFLSNVASVLRPGGLFFGFMPDSGAIWSQCQKRYTGEELPAVTKELFSIRFHSHDLTTFGARYNLQMDDGKNAQQFYLVHMHTFLVLAEEVGLELIEIENLSSFYLDKNVAFRDLLKEEGVTNDPSKPIGESTMDLYNMYAAFVFRRV